MRLKTSILMLLCLWATIAAKASGEKLYTSDVMSNSLVTSIVQDNHGFIWIGTAYGLNKFDGYRHTAYIHNSADERSLVGNNVSTLYVSRSGALLVGCVNGLHALQPQDRQRIEKHCHQAYAHRDNHRRHHRQHHHTEQWRPNNRKSCDRL